MDKKGFGGNCLFFFPYHLNRFFWAFVRADTTALAENQVNIEISTIAQSGQYISQRPHWLHFSLSTTGLKTRHIPVFPAAPCVGLLIARR
jgi:hypothetical protein